jgi:hypothetical protein
MKNYPCLFIQYATVADRKMSDAILQQSTYRYCLCLATVTHSKQQNKKTNAFVHSAGWL